MNIYAQPGTKVRFIEQNVTEAQINWGGHSHPRVLNYGDVYTLDRTEVHSMHTRVFLEEFPGKYFNSVWFEEVEEL